MDVRVDFVVPLPDPGEMRARVVRALGEVADVCLEEANRTVPIEEGTLEGSGHTSVDAGALQAQVAYGTPYAVVQHEDTSLRHDAGRRAKWLELTVNENQKRYEQYIADAAARG